MSAATRVPGVTVDIEQRGGPATPDGLRAGLASFVGYTPWGPVDQPVEVASTLQFERIFGEFTDRGLIPTLVPLYFENGGQALVVVRVLAADNRVAVCATTDVVPSAVYPVVPAMDGVASAFSIYDANALPVLPVDPGSVVITTSAGVGSENFTDDRLGGLTGSAGGWGRINYDSGELDLYYASAPAAGLSVSVAYDYRRFTFELRWPGEAGNAFEIQISGDANYLDRTTQRHSRFVLTVHRWDADTLNTLESFSALSFTDSLDDRFVVDVINDDLAGSQWIEAFANGHDEVPTQIETEEEIQTLVESPSYDGVEQAFAYPLANTVEPYTLRAHFRFVENDVQVGVGDGTNAPAVVLPASPVAIESVAFSCTVPGSGWAPPATEEIFAYAGYGLLVGSEGGAGTLDLDTGAITVRLGNTGLSTVSAAIVASYRYRANIVVDDGSGNVAIEPGDGPAQWILEPNGVNEIDYGQPSETATLQLQWRNTTDATAGPATGFLGVVQGTTIWTQTVQGETLTPTQIYDGDRQLFRYPMAQAVERSTLRASFALVENLLQVGTGDGTDTPVIELPGSPVAVDEVTMRVVVPTTSGAPTSEVFASDGAGTSTLTGDNGGNGVFDPVLGSVAVIMGGGDTSAVGVPITASYRYLPHILVDNGEGTVSIEEGGSGPDNWQVGYGRIEYGTSVAVASISLLWVNEFDSDIGPTSGPDVAPEQTAAYQRPETLVCPLHGGDDGGEVTGDRIVGSDRLADGGGVYALDVSPELLNVVVPDFETDLTVSNELIRFCEERSDRFAIVSVPVGLNMVDSLAHRMMVLDSSRAGLYAPQVTLPDPQTGALSHMPPGAFVAAVMARVDNTRGVAKAPAGRVDGALVGTLGVERKFSDSEMAELNEQSVNLLVNDLARGRSIWGSRSLEIGGDFPHVPMRRSFMFIQKSLEFILVGYVFETMGSDVRFRTRMSIDLFMLEQYNSGAFAGVTPAEGFYVVERSTKNDINNALLVFEVGMAPVKPSEFISITLRQQLVAQ